MIQPARCMPPGNGYVGPRLGLNGVVHIYESPPSSPCGVRPVLVGPGRGWAASEPPLFSPLYGSPGVPAGSWRWPSFRRVRTKALARVAGARPKPPPRPFPGSHRRKTAIARLLLVGLAGAGRPARPDSGTMPRRLGFSVKRVVAPRRARQLAPREHHCAYAEPSRLRLVRPSPRDFGWRGRLQKSGSLARGPAVTGNRRTHAYPHRRWSPASTACCGPRRLQAQAMGGFRAATVAIS